MADITMCASLTCPLRNGCYRFKATASSRQSYFVESPYSVDGCKYFWPISGGATFESKEYEDRSRHRNNYESQEDSRSSDKER